MPPTPISVSVCCMNNRDTIEPCLRSVRGWADEIVVVDSGSTDGTAEVAGALSDRFVHEPFRGYTEQKRYAASLCRNAWVLVLDSDEEATAELKAEIDALPAWAFERCDVMEMPRRNFVMGRWVRAWSPDRQSRLIHRDRVRWEAEVLHDKRVPSASDRLRRLKGPIDHKRHSAGGFRDYFDGKLEDARLVMVAEQMHARGRRCRPWDLLVRPAAAFFKFYVLKGGFLDGTFGLLIGQKAWQGSQLKYAALWAVQRGLARGDQPDDSRPPEGPAAEAGADAASASSACAGAVGGEADHAADRSADSS